MLGTSDCVFSFSLDGSEADPSKLGERTDLRDLVLDSFEGNEIDPSELRENTDTRDAELVISVDAHDKKSSP